MDVDVLHESYGDSFANPIMLNVQGLHGRHWICLQIGQQPSGYGRHSNEDDVPKPQIRPFGWGKTLFLLILTVVNILELFLGTQKQHASKDS